MSSRSVTDTARLAELLSRERELLENMDTLTDEQERLLKEDDIDAFNVSLNKRQEIIVKIDALHQESDLLMQSRVLPGSAEDAEAAKLREGNRALLAQIYEKNSKNYETAKKMSEQFKTQSNKLNMSRKSIGKYVQGVSYEGGHFDQKT